MVNNILKKKLEWSLEAQDFIPLEITSEGRRRFSVNVYWEPRAPSSLYSLEKEVERISSDKMFLSFFSNLFLTSSIRMCSDSLFTEINFDLNCYIYDKNKKFVMKIDKSCQIDSSGKVYHSGDNPNGHGGKDKENIYIELTGLPEDFGYFVFTIVNQGKIESNMLFFVQIRDSKTETVLYESHVNAFENTNLSAFVFACLSHKDNTIYLRKINEFQSRHENWPEYLKKHLV